ncbi:MAG: lipoyl synthase [Thermaerobacter sp.]|nr:lipoyl synthase [Thermaerobacter sp.]
MPLEQKDLGRRPDWLRVKLPSGGNFQQVQQMMRGHLLHTVCEEARCPNIGECWNNRTATFMILGRVCTRHCGFCAVQSGRPNELDLQEPARVAEVVADIGLNHVVVTSVARDDLEDGGASIFAATIRAIRDARPECSIEVLIPDFQGNWDALQLVMDARPDILNHNIETVTRLSDRVRSKAKYPRSLELLRRAKLMEPRSYSKSGIMLGLGEERDEIVQALHDLRDAGVDIVTIGQYLRPTMHHLPLQRYYTPDEFADLKAEALAMGFAHCESGPLVRSSYHAHAQVPAGRVPSMPVATTV